jgi:hypothetical protein
VIEVKRSGRFSMVFIPMSAVAKHGVENRQQLAHGGHQGHLGRFPGFAQPAIKGFKDGVMTAIPGFLIKSLIINII